MQTQTVFGQPSWTVKSDNVTAHVTKLGGMMGPVAFDLEDRTVQPFSVAPWCDEGPSDRPGILRALRGDFFCMPFGGSAEPYLGEDHPLHGETANEEWAFDSTGRHRLDLVLETRVRPSKVYKTVRCGDLAVMQKHTVLGLSGPMCFGMHAMVAFRSPGILSFGGTHGGHVFPAPFEDPALGGYSSLKAGAKVTDLSHVPMSDGSLTDLTRFPAREGFDDLVQLASDRKQRLGWSAVTFPDEGYAYYQLKDTSVLPTTVLWFSNGGRHYAPWSGRHRNVVGIEETCSYFHLGLRGSVAPNPFQAEGIETYRDCRPSEPLEVTTVCGVVPIGPGFGSVAAIVATTSGITLVGESGARIERTCEPGFLPV
ncbi:MAG: hypothetical protein JST30_06755 [Armatimonadetes bacterium]|nr:hypothetical protein [Armatimonadota bacterium]